MMETQSTLDMLEELGIRLFRFVRRWMPHQLLAIALAGLLVTGDWVRASIGYLALFWFVHRQIGNGE